MRRALGEGGRKRVYLAHDEKLDRDVAFALIKTDGLDTQGLSRVRREAQAMARLGDHPHVVTVFDTGEEGGRPYIVSQFMAGGAVDGMAMPLPTERTLEIVKGVCRGLAHAHAQGVVHRDLKPGNVWLAADGTAKIGDFGLAVALDQSRLTMAGMLVGTVAYMAPEQALGGEVTPRADLYALGCMLYELVTGRPPFVSDNATAVLSQHLNTAPVAPSWLTDHCPPELEELILRLLTKDPGERPASADEVLAALERVDPAARSASHSESNVLERLARGVFVGREKEMERLRKAFDEALAGRGSMLMLVGEPGIGKTRATQELETYARLRGATVLWGRAYEGLGAPAYWPWVQLGNQYATNNDLTELQPDMQGKGAALAPLFPFLREGPDFIEPEPLADPEAAQFRLLDAYATFVRGMAARAPLLVALDDLHWADKPSLLLLQHLARELGRTRVLLVGTYRDTDLSRTHPLSDALATLNRHEGFQRVVLRGLSRDEVAAYISATANVSARPELVDRIYEETEGNPFFLSEVVNLLTQEGKLSESVSDIAVPDGVREALGRRLDRISEEANELLQVAAVVGREFPYETLTLLGERPEDELLRLIEEALEARVIDEMEQPGRYRFTHALMQETLLDELSTTRRVRIHGQVGDALERRWGARADERASRLAVHFVEAATVSPRYAAKAAHYAKLAAQQAEAQFAWADAARQYEACLTLTGETDDNLGESDAELLASLGVCERNDGAYRAAWRALMRAIALYKQRGDAQGVARTTLEALRIDAPPARQLALARAAITALTGADLYLEAQLLGAISNPYLSSEQEAAPSRARAIELARDHGFKDVEATVTSGDAIRANIRREFERAAELFAEAYRQFATAGQVHDAALAQQSWAFNILLAGDLEAGRLAAEEGLAYARQHHIAFVEMVTAGFVGSVLLARCEFEAFDALCEERSANPGYLIDLMRAARAEMAGDLERAVALLPDPRVAGGFPLYLLQIHAGRARVIANAGEVARARDEYARMGEAINNNPTSSVVDGVAMASPVVAQLDEALPALADENFVRAAQRVISARPSAFDPTGRSAARVRATLALHLGLLDEAESSLRDTLAWCERERCPVEAGRCLQGLAEIAARRNDRREALRLLDRAAALFQQHGAKLYLDRVIAKKLELQGLTASSIYASIQAIADSVQDERPDVSLHAAPDGTVTIMFGDIEGSTPLNQRLGDEAYAALLRQYVALVRAGVERHGGQVVKHIGDGFMAAFPATVNAVRCSIALQRSVGDHRFAEAIRMRVGLHAGSPVREGADFFGVDVTLASRITDLANGGEVVASSAVRDLLGEATEATRFGEPREVELRGLSGRHVVHTVECGAT